MIWRYLLAVALSLMVLFIYGQWVEKQRREKIAFNVKVTTEEGILDGSGQILDGDKPLLFIELTSKARIDRIKVAEIVSVRLGEPDVVVTTDGLERKGKLSFTHVRVTTPAVMTKLPREQVESIEFVKGRGPPEFKEKDKERPRLAKEKEKEREKEREKPQEKRADRREEEPPTKREVEEFLAIGYDDTGRVAWVDLPEHTDPDDTSGEASYRALRSPRQKSSPGVLDVALHVGPPSGELDWDKALVSGWEEVPQAPGAVSGARVHQAETAGVRVTRTLRQSGRRLVARYTLQNITGTDLELQYRVYGPVGLRGESTEATSSDLLLVYGALASKGGAETRAKGTFGEIEVQHLRLSEAWRKESPVRWVGTMNTRFLAALSLEGASIAPIAAARTGVLDAVDGAKEGNTTLRASLQSGPLRLGADQERVQEYSLFVGPRDPAILSQERYARLGFPGANHFRVNLSPRFAVEVDSWRGFLRGFYLRGYRESVNDDGDYQLLFEPFEKPGPLALELVFLEGEGEEDQRTRQLWAAEDPWEYHEVDGESGNPEILLKKTVEGLAIRMRVAVPPPAHFLGRPADDPEVLALDPDLGELGSNHLRVALDIQNVSSAEKSFRYHFYGPAAIDTEHFRAPGNDIEFAVGTRTQSGVVVEVHSAKEHTKSDPTWVGISNSYFSSIFVPVQEKDRFVSSSVVTSFADPARVADLVRAAGRGEVSRVTPGERKEFEEKAFKNLGVYFVSLPLDLQSGDPPLRNEYFLYAGPRDERLKLYGDLQFDGVNVYSSISSLFSDLVKFFIWLLGVLKSVGMGSWGVGIILLTLVVKLCLHPVNRRSQKSMTRFQKKFQKIQPELKKLQERYKGDRMKLHQETQKLFKEHGVNPGQQMAGCLILVLQLPIWICLYTTLQYAIGLRQAEFLYIKDLTQPDQMFDLGFQLPLLGHYFNLLPVLYVILTVVNQRLQPRPQDPQMQAQHRMMTFMMVFFGFIFYRFPAGFMLYIMTSSALGIVESKVIKAQLAREDATSGTGNAAAAPVPVAAYPAKAPSSAKETSSMQPGRTSKRQKGKRRRR